MLDNEYKQCRHRSGRMCTLNGRRGQGRKPVPDQTVMVSRAQNKRGPNLHVGTFTELVAFNSIPCFDTSTLLRVFRKVSEYTTNNKIGGRQDGRLLCGQVQTSSVASQFATASTEHSNYLVLEVEMGGKVLREASMRQWGRAERDLRRAQYQDPKTDVSAENTELAVQRVDRLVMATLKNEYSLIRRWRGHPDKSDKREKVLNPVEFAEAIPVCANLQKACSVPLFEDVAKVPKRNDLPISTVLTTAVSGTVTRPGRDRRYGRKLSQRPGRQRGEVDGNDRSGGEETQYAWPPFINIGSRPVKCDLQEGANEQGQSLSGNTGKMPKRSDRRLLTSSQLIHSSTAFNAASSTPGQFCAQRKRL
ncbi:hypothetical protein DFH94DRAFT_841814 [Russula ochroleuca]|uniref:Uncharacterized protein n=1 Tax=Russula ochroleuca TaxID=152965 RepID=A0A9P5N7J4_9AGAM|nr:hypothetical protein DFH94DRAFT_841814 [Russula ochroleuca]